MDRYTEKRRWLILFLGITALVLICLALPAASPVATAQPPAPETPTVRPTPDWSAPHVPGQLLVKFADTSAAERRDPGRADRHVSPERHPATRDCCS